MGQWTGKAFASEAKNIWCTKEQLTSSKRAKFYFRLETVVSKGNLLPVHDLLTKFEGLNGVVAFTVNG